MLLIKFLKIISDTVGVILDTFYWKFKNALFFFICEVLFSFTQGDDCPTAFPLHK